jgi:hypothetical protein
MRTAIDTIDHLQTATDLVCCLVDAPESWRSLVRYPAHGRYYERIELPSSVSAEAWVITWAPNSGLPRHDHGGAAGALAVVEGELTEEHGRREAPGLLRRRLLRPGPVVGFDADHVHEVRNLGWFPAVSLHVYAPGLEVMDFFGGER